MTTKRSKRSDYESVACAILVTSVLDVLGLAGCLRIAAECDRAERQAGTGRCRHANRQRSERRAERRAHQGTAGQALVHGYARLAAAGIAGGSGHWRAFNRR